MITCNRPIRPRVKSLTTLTVAPVTHRVERRQGMGGSKGMGAARKRVTDLGKRVEWRGRVQKGRRERRGRKNRL